MFAQMTAKPGLPPDDSSVNDYWTEHPIILTPIDKTAAEQIKQELRFKGDQTFVRAYRASGNDPSHGTITVVPFDIYVLLEQSACVECRMVIAHRAVDAPHNWVYRAAILPLPISRVSPDQSCGPRQFMTLLLFGTKSGKDDGRKVVALTNDEVLLGNEITKKCDH